MNIEEERKAFEKIVPGNLEYVNFVINESSIGLLECMEKAFFEVWLAAKAHVAKTAKPTVRILPKSPSNSYRSSYPFVVSLFEGSRFDGALEDFRTMEDAKAWAENNGYQVLPTAE